MALRVLRIESAISPQSYWSTSSNSSAQIHTSKAGTVTKQAYPFLFYFFFVSGFSFLFLYDAPALLSDYLRGNLIAGDPLPVFAFTYFASALLFFFFFPSLTLKSPHPQRLSLPQQKFHHHTSPKYKTSCLLYHVPHWARARPPPASFLFPRCLPPEISFPPEPLSSAPGLHDPLDRQL